MLLKRENYLNLHVFFFSLDSHWTQTVTSAGVMLHIVMPTLTGDDVVCSVKLSKVRHVPRDHVFG